MKKKMFENVAATIITAMMLVVMLFLSVVSLLFRSYIDVTYQEIIYYRKDNILIAMLFLTLVLAALWFGKKKGILERLPQRPLLIFMLIYVAMVSGVWSYVSHSFPVADQASILECVEGMMNGDYTCMTYKGYLQYNRHQVGLTAFFEVFTRLFTGGQVKYEAVYILNTILITGIFLEMYLITRELTDSKEAVNIELLLSLGLFQLMMYSTFVYGLIPGLFFALAGIFFMLKLLKTKRWQYGVAMALMLALSVVMKSNYLIFIIAVGGVLCVKAISERKVMYLLFVILAFAGFASINKTAQSVYENRSGIAFGDTIPNSAYVAMGMQDGKMAPGWFNGYNHVTYRKNGYDAEVTDALAKEYIGERISEFINDPMEALEFYYYKIVSQWNEVTYECLWISTNEGNHIKELSPFVQSIYTGRMHTVVEAIMNLYQLLIFTGTLLLCWCLRKEKDISKTILLLTILGGFLFHILWEGKSQYLISYIPLMVPCAAIGLEGFLQKAKERK